MNKYCVYLHRRKTDGTVFYVGSGTKTRAYSFSKSSRSASWYSEFLLHGCIVDIFEDSLSKEDSLILEYNLIEKYKNIIVNKLNNAVNAHELNCKMFSDLFYYDETSPSCLRVKTKRRGSKFKVGDDAAYFNHDVFTVRVNRKNYLAHRVIWAMLKGDCPSDKVIDHIDGNRSNNKISNLRLVTPCVNSKNRKVNGVYECVFKGNRYFATSAFRKVFRFSIVKHGYDLSFKYASSLRNKLLMQDGDFTERHIGCEDYFKDKTIDFLLSKTTRVGLTNTSGTKHVYRSSEGYGCWVFSIEHGAIKHTKRFLVSRFGEEYAKTLCVLYKNYYLSEYKAPISLENIRIFNSCRGTAT